MEAGAHDSVELKVFDDRGKQVNNRHGQVFSVQKKDGKQIKEMRAVLNKISSSAKYIMVYPEISRGMNSELDKMDPIKIMLNK
jgi:hypothetical protein